MPRTAELSRPSTADGIDNGDHLAKDNDQTSADDTAIWIFGKKPRLIPAAVLFNEWRRRATPRRRQPPH